MTIRIGVLGCGTIARSAHLLSLARTAGATVVAIADSDPTSLAGAQPLAPKAGTVRDFREVIEAPGVDAIVIALPPALHAEAAIAALAHGKHVYVEKPLATSVSDAQRVIAAWERSGLIGMMGLNYRYNPLVRHARARLTAGAIGAPLAARTVFATPRRTIPSWKTQRSAGGGVLLDLAVHHIDLVRFLFDAEIGRVSADVRSVASNDDTAFLQLGLTNGVTAQSMCSLSAVEEDRIEIYGSSGKLTVDRYRSLRVDESPATAGSALSGAVTGLASEMRALPYAVDKFRSPMHDPSFPLAMEAFVRAVEQRVPADPSLRDGLRALAVIEAAEQSARSGRVIDLDVPTNVASSSLRRDVAGV
jgi:myo-inositol 2-dehydrogenase / D-chiro-inositol 1-dehydrogenase